MVIGSRPPAPDLDEVVWLLFERVVLGSTFAQDFEGTTHHFLMMLKADLLLEREHALVALLF